MNRLDRRHLLQQIAAGGGLAAVCLATSANKRLMAAEQSPSHISRFVLTARGTYGTPKYNAKIRVPGIHVMFSTEGPPDAEAFYVALYVQVRAQTSEDPSDWRDVNVIKDNRGDAYCRSEYQRTAREWIRLYGGHGEQKELPYTVRPIPVYMFLPDEILDLRSETYQVRYQIRFFDEDKTHLNLDTSIPSFVATYQRAGRYRELQYGFGAVHGLEIDINDIVTDKQVDLSALVG